MALSNRQRDIERRGYTEGVWKEFPNFSCVYCPFASLDQTTTVLHVRGRHRDQLYQRENPVGTEIAAVEGGA